jgi:hypothetical protein
VANFEQAWDHLREQLAITLQKEHDALPTSQP